MEKTAKSIGASEYNLLGGGMTIYPVQYGENPRTFLYSASHIMKHDGLIEIFSDKGAELQIQLKPSECKKPLQKFKNWTQQMMIHQ